MYHDPDAQTEARDQRRFDEAVNREGRIVLSVLAGVGILAAVVMSTVALIQSGGKSEGQSAVRHNAVAMAASASMPMMGSNAAATASTAARRVIDLQVIPNGKPGPDGKKHDAFTQTNFTVKAGQPVTLRIDNKDSMPHSITAPMAGVNITVTEGVHTYTLVVKQAGKFQWYCMPRSMKTRTDGRCSTPAS